MEKNQQSKNERLKWALCYLPFISIVIYFIEVEKTDFLKKHIKYGLYLFIIYFLLNIVLSWFFLWILFLVYIFFIGALFFKVYNWEKVELEYIDKLDEKIKETFCGKVK